jgi:hypothetical protein
MDRRGMGERWERDGKGKGDGWERDRKGNNKCRKTRYPQNGK